MLSLYHGQIDNSHLIAQLDSGICGSHQSLAYKGNISLEPDYILAATVFCLPATNARLSVITEN
ncbi:MAG: hypothetical protein WAO71_05340 [Gallionella sp.]